VRQRLEVEAAVTPRGVVAPAAVLVDGGVIAAVGTPAEIGDVDVPAERHAGTLVPGFVDLQVNGIGGHQYGAGQAGLRATASALLASGVTAHCPTITTRAWDRYPDAFAALGAPPGAPAPGSLGPQIEGPLLSPRQAGAHDVAAPGAPPGAPAPRSLGLHLEGPFLSPRQAGAHDVAALVEPSAARVEELLAWADHDVAIVTLAPELPGAGAAIGLLRAAGVVVSAGHTDATYEQLRTAVDAGVSMVTHVFNAQRGLGHREPGTAGAALLLDQLDVGIILDRVHVHAELAALVLSITAGRVFAVTDAVATAGLPPARYEFDGVAVDTTSGAPRLADGTLAGSNLTMDAAFRFVAACRGLVDAVAATATTPARAIGRDDLGVLAPGAAADLVLLDDDLQVAAVWRDGVPVA